jgi:hypothetical protein
MRTFGHTRPVRDPADGTVMINVASPVTAVTVDELGGQFGKDKYCRLVLTCEAGDVIGLRPTGTQRKLTATATDIGGLRPNAFLPWFQMIRMVITANSSHRIDILKNHYAHRIS